MSGAWTKELAPEPLRLTPMGWTLALGRGVVLAVLVFGCLALLLLVRLVERPLFGLRRPVTPFITQFVCRNAFRVMGIAFTSRGELMRGRGAVVSNHVSWLDIFALNARKRIYFVSKAEVAGWPGIGWLARATGTVFIERDPKRAREHKEVFEGRLLAGHKLLFFPEGTSTDGLTVLPFKTTLFAAFFSHDLRPHMAIQPVTLLYHAPEGARADFYGWWGDMDFGSHLVKVLGRRRQGRVELVYHAPVRVSDFHDRKALAAHVERVIRDCHEKCGLGAAEGG